MRYGSHTRCGPHTRCGERTSSRAGIPAAALVLIAALVPACDDPTPTPGSSSASATATSTASAKAKPSAAPLAKPSPLNLEALKKSLKCGGKASSGPCPVLEKFESCRENWSPITQSGDGRWIGNGAVVKKGQFVEEMYMMRSRRVGLAAVAPGALGVKIALTEIPNDDANLRTSAGKTWRKLNRGDTPKVGMHAVEFINDHENWPEAYAQQADAHQIYVAAGAGTYLCGDPSSQALYAVKLAGSQEHPGDGIYVTLYPTKW